MKKMIISYLMNHTAIIAVFLIINLIGIIGMVFDKDFASNQLYADNKYLLLKIISFVTYLIIGFFAYKNIKVVRWLMALIIFLTGIHASILGAFGIDWTQYILKPYFIIIGIYFICAGVFLSCSKKKLNEFLTSGSSGTH